MPKPAAVHVLTLFHPLEFAAVVARAVRGAAAGLGLRARALSSLPAREDAIKQLEALKPGLSLGSLCGLVSPELFLFPAFEDGRQAVTFEHLDLITAAGWWSKLMDRKVVLHGCTLLNDVCFAIVAPYCFATHPFLLPLPALE